MYKYSVTDIILSGENDIIDANDDHVKNLIKVAKNAKTEMDKYLSDTISNNGDDIKDLFDIQIQATNDINNYLNTKHINDVKNNNKNKEDLSGFFETNIIEDISISIDDIYDPKLKDLYKKYNNYTNIIAEISNIEDPNNLINLSKINEATNKAKNDINDYINHMNNINNANYNNMKINDNIDELNNNILENNSELKKLYDKYDHYTKVITDLSKYKDNKNVDYSEFYEAKIKTGSEINNYASNLNKINIEIDLNNYINYLDNKNNYYSDEYKINIEDKISKINDCINNLNNNIKTKNIENEKILKDHNNKYKFHYENDDKHQGFISYNANSNTYCYTPVVDYDEKLNTKYSESHNFTMKQMENNNKEITFKNIVYTQTGGNYSMETIKKIELNENNKYGLMQQVANLDIKGKINFPKVYYKQAKGFSIEGIDFDPNINHGLIKQVADHIIEEENKSKQEKDNNNNDYDYSNKTYYI